MSIDHRERGDNMATTALAKPDLATLVDKINSEHRACEASLQAGLAHALEAGKLLMEAKAQLKHGGFHAWVAKNTECSKRTAQRYMQIARDVPKLGDAKATRVSRLSYRDALTELGKSARQIESSPAEHRDRIIELWESGEQKTAGRAKTQVRREARHQLEVDLAADDRHEWEVETVESWSNKHFDELATDPELANQLPALNAELGEAERTIERLTERARELHGIIDDEETRITNAVQQKHGWLVPLSWIAVKVSDQINEELTRLQHDDESQLQKQLWLHSHRCTRCSSDLLFGGIAVPNDGHAMCNWCREHRGETHCRDCGKPLGADDDSVCAECEEDV